MIENNEIKKIINTKVNATILEYLETLIPTLHKQGCLICLTARNTLSPIGANYGLHIIP